MDINVVIKDKLISLKNNCVSFNQEGYLYCLYNEMYKYYDDNLDCMRNGIKMDN